ncbi:WbqC family protein [Cetobacterium sp. 2G large]|uniref:WbqC family protein n=1 Tax=Cetobacterium sp. 2G large TaxID=2759680 RepID=UPI00163B77F7|nr:WbqC family protein [Cetobacterium sp. 2G large]MBC2852337.1 WbqC family protein [Cetobacterium sp. 2G large]
MKIGMMQPYFFPYIGYFSLIKYCEKWIIFDSVKYINKGWVNRNRILKQNGLETNYITVPIERISSKTLIKDIKINKNIDWKNKILGELTIYKKAPFFKEVMSIVNDVLSYNTESLCELNIYSLKVICKYLNINFNFQIFSQLKDFPVESVQAPDEWALYTAKYFNATEYVNPPGGKSFFNPIKYQSLGIKLTFLAPILNEYKTFSPTFIPGLSIIDVMFWNSKEDINKMLDNFILDEFP